MTPASGVAMTVPPRKWLPAIQREIDRAVAEQLNADAKGGLIAIATTSGVNLAIVQKIGEHGDVVAFIGKRWSAPISGGAAVRLQW